jgi:hypothetical protein
MPDKWEATMKKILGLILIVLFVLPAGDALARKRPHVVIHKQPVCNYPGCDGAGTRRRVEAIGVLAFIAPPLAVAYDLQRRTNCEGDVLGLGGPGFSSPITPATGNVMTTAYMRGECPNVAPRRR